MNLIRTRWAAIGAAIAVAVGGGGLATVSAVSSSGERAVFVPISPCRLFDTRAATTVGAKATPLTANEVYTVAGRGTSGKCTLPADATALSLNVTAVGATLGTFLTLYPADAPERPDSSSLNPAPGQGPTPNGVNVDLSATGQFSVFNLQGDVDVFADVNGYYVDHDHDDRYYTQAEIDALVDSLEPTPPTTTPSAGTIIAMGFVNTAGGTIFEGRTAPGVEVTLTHPATGRIDLTVTGADTTDAPIVMITAHNPTISERLCNTRSLVVDSPTSYTVRVDCYDVAGTNVGIDTPFQYAIMD